MCNTTLHKVFIFAVETKRTILQAAVMAERDFDKNEALLWAIGYGNDANVEFLLQAGADPNFKNWYGQTPLGVVKFFGENSRAAIAKMLRDAGMKEPA
jgi:ankyrin repeat protein